MTQVKESNMLKELMEAIELGYKEIRDEQDRIRESEARKLREEEERNQKKLNQFPEWMHPYGKVIFQDFLQVEFRFPGCVPFRGWKIPDGYGFRIKETVRKWDTPIRFCSLEKAIALASAMFEESE